eukprot:gene17516-19266_t
MLCLYLLVTCCTGFVFSSAHEAVDCSMRDSSCESCHAAYPFCYWCEGECRRYYGKKFAQIECKGDVMYERCDNEMEVKRLGKMLQLLQSLKQTKASGSEFSSNQQNEVKEYQPIMRPTEPTKRARLLRVLKLLKLLAVLETKKNKNNKSGQTVGKIDNQLPHEYPGNAQNKIDTPAITRTGHEETHKSQTDSDLDALLRLVEIKQTTQAPGKHVTEHKKTSSKPMPSPTTIPKEKLSSSKTHSEVIPATKLNRTSTQKMTTFNSTLLTSKTTTSASRYCVLFELEDQCNSDHDCSWCNILNKCLGRTKEDFEYCTRNDKRSQAESSYDPNDECLAQSDCKSCTGKGKCYWCEKTKSCHTYPFFGFIPHNCPANMWYYKECDRMLKVQLFEKPELFEKRKGKKVYFVGGDDEDDESRTEQIRKKYNLPHEKEPLISP